ncbi:hypothetical protein KAU33_05440 [Candidatus Dependentiae bacterium]|nr:hypothetical protein [Candidatus Dependentiae bacterium]
MDELNLNSGPSWCGSCPNYPFLTSFKEAIEKLHFFVKDFVCVMGVGNSAQLSHYLDCNFINVPPGQAFSAATGIRMANHDLNVIVISGDGDLLSTGINSFIHSARKNINITVLVQNNLVLCSSQGYPSPTTPVEFQNKFQNCNLFEPVSIIKIALASGASYVARGAVARSDHLEELIIKGIKHKGFSVIEIIQPCSQVFDFGTIMEITDQFQNIDDENSEPDNLPKAYAIAVDKTRIPIGLFFRSIQSTFRSKFPLMIDDSLISQGISRKKLDAYFQKLLKP